MAEEPPQFDFIAHLHHLDPDVVYSIHEVTGGVVNVTVRAVKGASSLNKGRFAGHGSLILKYAPPYIAKIGKEAPFSESRQDVEAAALKLLGDELHDVVKDSTITVPELLHHDPRAHVLIIEDLGRHLDLTEVFSDLGGSHPSLEPVPARHGHFGQERLSSESAAYFQDIGQRVGAFFARLHDTTTKEIITNREEFLNPEGRRLVLDASVTPAMRRLKEFLGPEGQDKASSLEKIVMEDVLRDTPEEELSFTLGDCWPSAILVSDPGTKPLVGVIDWEFAKLGQGAAGDMAQLMAHLDMLRISAKQAAKFNAHGEALNVLVTAIIGAYRERSGGQSEEEGFHARRMRSAFINCAVEMIDCAMWKKWVCADPSCNQDHGGQTNTMACPVVKSISAKGVSLLELAGESLEVFQSKENQRRIEAVDASEYKEGENWLLDLFR